MGKGTDLQTQELANQGTSMSFDIDALRRAFLHQFGRQPTVISEAPGRVNLIGEHTDYNDGLVLPLAIDRSVAVAAAEGGDTVRAYSADFEARDEWRIDAPRRTGRTEWRDYLRGVAWALLDAGHRLCGGELVIAGDVPQEAGLSSSAALEVAVAGALLALSRIQIEPRALALLCQKAENQFVGVQCGIMDQLAAACGREGHALLIDCRSLEVEHVPLVPGVVIIVVNSGVNRRLEDTAYNRRREECAEAARMLEMASLREAGEATLEEFRDRLPETLFRRARHVVTENARVLAAAESLRSGDTRACGRVMFESHVSLRNDFEVSTPELDLLVEFASCTEGALGARLTGAGFGGCTVNLVTEGAEERFRAEVAERYSRETGLVTEMQVCKAVGGLEVKNV